MMMPPSVVPWPPMNFVSEWITTSAPWLNGLSRNGVATVLSAMIGNATGMGHFGHRGEIDDVAGGVADRLAEHRLRPLVDPSGD